jgi:hypothetical protein
VVDAFDLAGRDWSASITPKVLKPSSRGNCYRRAIENSSPRRATTVGNSPDGQEDSRQPAGDVLRHGDGKQTNRSADQ